MKFSALLILLLGFSAFGFDKDFTTINDRAPYEFSLLFNSLKSEIKAPSEKLRMIALCKDLNDNLGFLQKEHIFMLMKTEVIKGTLEYKFDKVRKYDVNTLLVKRLDEDFKRKKAQLSSFSRWIWQSIIAELKYRENLGLVTATSFNPGNFEGAKRIEAVRFQKYLTYLHPWIDKMDGLDAISFNQLSKDVSWSILERINDRSLLFKRFASTAQGNVQVIIINIPQKLLDLKPEDIKNMQNDTLPLSLSDQSKIEKTKASEEIDKVTPLDMSPISDDVAKELEKQAPAP